MQVSQPTFQFPDQTSFYRGKVRDVYFFGQKIAVVASNRISAFDVILPKSIPYKGEVLNRTAAYFLEATRDIIPNWLVSMPDPQVSIGLRCEPIKVEMVVRGYLAGHAWRVYQSGERVLCGVQLPDGLRESEKLPQPTITPTTKADEGHDLDISREEIIKSGLVTEALYTQMEEAALRLFQRGTEMAASRGLILVDTKYEFGLYEGALHLIDEVHTPDSSRYYYSNAYADNLRQGLPQKQLSKEFVRTWLMENGFQGKEGQEIPFMSDEFVEEISQRYIETFELVTGTHFTKVSQVRSEQERIRLSIITALEHAS
jgi:phosphoribosylaminoimidazole-succinocarboxamide synthase